MTERLKTTATMVDLLDEIGMDFEISVHQSIDSTNSWCLRQSKMRKPLPFACFAESQTDGRGRRGKDWLMPAGSNIAMSIAWAFDVSHQQLQFLPLSSAIVIAETLESFGLIEVKIKWPNDVYVGDNKIAGILIETQPIKNISSRDLSLTQTLAQAETEAQSTAVVIGIGLNHDMSQLDDTERKGMMLTDVVTAAREQVLLTVPDRIALAAQLLKNMVLLCQDYAQVFEPSIEKFRRHYDYCKQKKVELRLDNNDVISGTAMGITDNAELLVLVDGKLRTFNSATVSVKVE